MVELVAHQQLPTPQSRCIADSSLTLFALQELSVLINILVYHIFLCVYSLVILWLQLHTFYVVVVAICIAKQHRKSGSMQP